MAAAWHACADITIYDAICRSSGSRILTCRHLNTTLLLAATLQPPFPSHGERTGSSSISGQPECPPHPSRWTAPDCATRASPLTWTPTPLVRPAHPPLAEPEPGEEIKGPSGGGWPNSPGPSGWGLKAWPRGIAVLPKHEMVFVSSSHDNKLHARRLSNGVRIASVKVPWCSYLAFDARLM